MSVRGEASVDHANALTGQIAGEYNPVLLLARESLRAGLAAAINIHDICAGMSTIHILYMRADMHPASPAIYLHQVPPCYESREHRCILAPIRFLAMADVYTIP